jgi:hypothetical protein
MSPVLNGQRPTAAELTAQFFVFVKSGRRFSKNAVIASLKSAEITRVLYSRARRASKGEPNRMSSAAAMYPA